MALSLTGLSCGIALGASAGCGSSAQKSSTKNRPAPLVHVFFCAEETCAKPATRQAELRTRRQIDRLVQKGLISKVVYISKAQALRTMKRKYPDLMKRLHPNPLPDAYDITPAVGQNPTEIVNLLSRAPGVENVNCFDRRTERACPR
jgi:cell division protein FtsX